jgi:hypothetical protein
MVVVADADVVAADGLIADAVDGVVLTADAVSPASLIRRNVFAAGPTRIHVAASPRCCPSSRGAYIRLTNPTCHVQPALLLSR